MTRLRGMLVCAGGLLSLTAAAAMAAPPVMDRVPDNAFAVIGMPSADAMHKDLSALMTAVEVPFPMPEVNDLLAMAGITGGVDTSKSIAIVLYPPKKDPVKDAAKKVGDAVKDASKKAAEAMGDDKAKDKDKDADDDEDEDDAKPQPRGVVLVPISKYEDLLANFGAKPGAAGSVDKVTSPDGNDAYVKDVGNGYAAMTDDQELLKSFEAKSGASPLKSKLGKSGDRVADGSDVFFVLNMDEFRPMWPEMKKEMEKKIKESTAALPVGEDADPMKNPGAVWFMDTLMKDGKALVAGMKAGNKGFGMDMALNFNEGSYMSKMFTGGGKTGDLLAKLPAGAYLMAGAMDLSSADMRQFLKDLTTKAAKPGDEPLMSGKSIDAMQGIAMTMGLPKGGILGGIMTGLVTYTKTSDVASYITATKDAMSKMNGKEMQGIKVQSNYVEKAAKVDDVDVDSWEMKMNADDGAAGASQGLAMIYGPTGGPSGYIAKVDGGVYQTFAKSSELMSTALKANKGGENLGSDKLMAQVAASLPGNRIGEFYIGTRSIMDMVLPFAAMAGVQVPAEKIPETLPPVAMALAGEDGSAHFAMFVPTPIIKAVVDVGMAIQAQEAGGAPDAAPAGGKGETGQPRF